MIWRDVVGYEGTYEVSSCGKVRSHKNKTTHSEKHGTRHWKQIILKQKISKDDTCRVCLYKDKKGRTWLVHRLVAKAFIPMVAGKEYINHLDGNRLNNSIENLEWCNHTENNNHAFDNGLIRTSEKVILLSKETHESLYFRSKSRASDYLGKNNGYISGELKKGKKEVGNYLIFTH